LSKFSSKSLTTFIRTCFSAASGEHAEDARQNRHDEHGRPDDPYVGCGPKREYRSENSAAQGAEENIRAQPQVQLTHAGVFIRFLFRQVGVFIYVVIAHGVSLYFRAADAAPPVGRLDTTERRGWRVKAPALACGTSAPTGGLKRGRRAR